MVELTLPAGSPDLSPESLSDLNSRLATNTLVHAHEVKGLRPTTVLAIGGWLEERGVVEMMLLIYHRCSPSFVEAVPQARGFPSFPRMCEICDEEIFQADAGFEVAIWPKEHPIVKVAHDDG